MQHFTSDALFVSTHHTSTANVIGDEHEVTIGGNKRENPIALPLLVSEVDHVGKILIQDTVVKKGLFKKSIF